jgi:hypothetical protein
MGLVHFEVRDAATSCLKLRNERTAVGRKASSKMIESAALVELSGALAATNR